MDAIYFKSLNPKGFLITAVSLPFEDTSRQFSTLKPKHYPVCSCSYDSLVHFVNNDTIRRLEMF